MRRPRSSAQARTLAAFDDVQTTPPCSPQKAFSAAAEFMYVTGTISSAPPNSAASSRQAPSTSGCAAMSAIEQPAARFGRTTCWWGPERMSAASAMKCTPQKTMYSDSGCEAA